MIDQHVEELVEPVYAALKSLTEDQLADLADALNRLQMAIDNVLIQRENGEDELDGEEELDLESW